MAEKVPQNFANHTRFDPPFHFFLAPVGLILLIMTIVQAVNHPSTMARLGRDFASAAVRNTCTVTYAPVPQSADTGTSTSAPPAGTDTIDDRTGPLA